MRNVDLNLYIKDNNTYINIPNEILTKGSDIVSDYIKIYTEIEVLKENINKYLFYKNSTINPLDIINKIVQIKKIESINEILPFLEIDLSNIEDRLIWIYVNILDTKNRIFN